MAIRCGRWTSIALLPALICVVVAGLAHAADREAMVGRWYGEVRHSSTYGKTPFDLRRWLAVKEADGTGQTTMRYYLDAKYQTETIETFKWGVTGDTYWEDCVSVKDDDGTRSCSTRTEYNIKKLTDSEFEHVSKRSGIEYREIKVPAQFILP